jgi:hypothetical protein
MGQNNNINRIKIIFEILSDMTQGITLCDMFVNKNTARIKVADVTLK